MELWYKIMWLEILKSHLLFPLISPLLIIKNQSPLSHRLAPLSSPTPPFAPLTNPVSNTPPYSPPAFAPDLSQVNTPMFKQGTTDFAQDNNRRSMGASFLDITADLSTATPTHGYPDTHQTPIRHPLYCWPHPALINYIIHLVDKINHHNKHLL